MRRGPGTNCAGLRARCAVARARRRAARDKTYMISSLTSDSILEGTSGLPLNVRKAGMSDIAPLLELINGYAAKGIMLPRTEFEMSENIRDFSVLYSGSNLIRCGSLHSYSPSVGAVRSLALDPTGATDRASR